jgi:hypothetical protein
VKRAFVSSEAERPGSFTLHEYPSPDSNRDNCGSEPQASAIGLEGHGASDGARTRSTSMASSRAAGNTSLTWEPARRIELRLLPYQGSVLTVITKQAWLGAQGSNLNAPGPKPGGSAGSPTTH